MPLPCDKPWRTEYGGALELYPVREWGHPRAKSRPRQGVPVELEPTNLSPSRYSFYSLEEEVVDQEDAWLSVSGWFHAAQPGKDGHISEEVTAPQEVRVGNSYVYFLAYSPGM